MDSVMIKGTHYDTIRGCGPKPVLLKAGAEKLALACGLSPAFEVDVDPIREDDLPSGHREYRVKCTMTTRDGAFIADGFGSCSTLEGKYRYRKDYKTGQRTENTDLADQWNTVLKMAKKRAFVDAVLTACGCSDYFTQDIDEGGERDSTTREARDVRAPKTEEADDGFSS